MNREMYNKCLNEDMVICARLPPEVRATLACSPYRQYLTEGLQWGYSNTSIMYDTTVYRIDPTVKVETEIQEIQEIPITFSKRTDSIYGCCLPETGAWRGLSSCICHVKFRGIVYTKDGVESVQQTINREHGVPIRVRFEKE